MAETQTMATHPAHLSSALRMVADLKSRSESIQRLLTRHILTVLGTNELDPQKKDEYIQELDLLERSLKELLNPEALDQNLLGTINTLREAFKQIPSETTT